MGLDGVELVMAFEEGFGVTIADAEAEMCTTPAKVIDLIFSKLRKSDDRVCVCQRAFCLLRRELIHTFGVPRQSVVLDADIRLFTQGIPEPEAWSKLKAAVNARSWPALTRPPWVVVGLWGISISTFCASLFQVHWAIALAFALTVAFAGARSTRPLRLRIPARFSRVRALVPFVVTSDAIPWTRDQVASLVKKMVIEQLGLREEQYREEAEFVKDLGMD